MFPPVFAVCSADTSVVTLLTGGDGRLLLFPGGEAPQQEARPYAVWQTIYGEPDNTSLLHPEYPAVSGFRFDIYGPTLDGVRNIAAALHGAIEHPSPTWFATTGSPAMRAPGRDRHWRYSFDVEWRDARMTSKQRS